MFSSILWCDEDIVVVDKPAGLPDGYDPVMGERLCLRDPLPPELQKLFEMEE